MPNCVTEKQLSYIWRQQTFESQGLATENGIPITVVYPGRINDRRGGDFCDAVITLDGRTVAGDVELHVKSSDWKTHGHDRDVNYNRVVLHVVFRNNSSPFTLSQDGTQIPVLALENTAEHCISEASSPGGIVQPCREITRRRGGTKAIADILDQAGDARFREKIEKLNSQLALIETGQTLYQGIMEVLGYSQNREPFLKLAHQLPLVILESVGAEKITDGEYFSLIYDKLITTAGLPSRQVSNIDRDAPGPVITSGLHSKYGWQMYHARPNNSPQLRTAAMAYLLVRYRHHGLLQGLLNRVREAPLNKGDQYLEKALIVADEENAPAASLLSGNLSPLGKSRARDITINILLPFAYAFGRLKKEPELKRKSMALYQNHGRLADNCIERHMAKQLSLPAKLVNSARHQQGLLYVYSRFCARGRCKACGLG